MMLAAVFLCMADYQDLKACDEAGSWWQFQSTFSENDTAIDWNNQLPLVGASDYENLLCTATLKSLGGNPVGEGGARGTYIDDPVPAQVLPGRKWD